MLQFYRSFRKFFQQHYDTFGANILYRLWLGTAAFLALCWYVTSVILLKISALLTVSVTIAESLGVQKAEAWVGGSVSIQHL